MKWLFYSTTRLVLAALVGALIILTFNWIISEDNFMIVMSAVIGYFFHKQWTDNFTDNHMPKTEKPVKIEQREDWVTYITFLD